MNGSTIMFPQSSSTVSDVLLMVTTFSVSKHLTRNDQDDLINLIKVLAGPAFESWNASHYSRSKAYNPPRKKIQSNFYCQTEKCQRILHTRKLSDKDKKIKVQCSDCKAKYKLSSASKNQFIIIDLKYQLKLLFRDTEVKNDLLNTMEKLRQPRNDGVIHDIYDGQLYKAVQKLSPGALTYNVNTDGAPLTKSSKRSMWLIQLHINELSPTLRFRNVLIGGLYITSAEPSPEFMQTYMSKFLEKANNIMEAGINITDNEDRIRNLKFFCLLLCVDSVARPVIQNRFQFNGYSGCSWCYATGVYDSSAMRYPITQQVPLLRTNQSHIKDVEQVEKLGKSINGVKDNCAMLELKHFDCVWGFPLDYMHGILLGVSRHLWALWIKPGTPYYLNPQQRKKIMARQLHIKRPQEIHRLVRTVDQTAKWKASEWESWLLFDSVPCLVGILDEKCFQSYLLLVSSIYTLMTDNISEEDLLLCEINILQFVRDCQLIYGVNSMTFNLHSLLHVVESVRQSGPLWSSSAFPFESMIFLIKRYITGVSGVSNQIVNSILKEKNIRCNIDYNTESVKCRNYCKDLFKPRKLKNCTRSDDHALLIGTEKSPDDQLILLMQQYFDNTHSTKVYDRCIYNKMVLRSTAYTRPTKTNDTVVQLDTKKFIRIDGFFSLNNTCYLYGNQILTVQTAFQSNVQLSHILQVTSIRQEILIASIQSIRTKVIFFSTGENDYICFFPKNLGT
ncbi:GSCOCG00012179001-RA-CDS [Cotesia congregata]|nr:GSCOCG00012179001-RA-CDS [Cotesia congregata]